MDLFHPAWRANDTPAIQPAILHGPMQEPRIPVEDRKRAELVNLASTLQTRLLDMEADVALPFTREFHDMLDHGDLSTPIVVQDPPA